MTDLPARTRAIIYISALLILIGLAIASVITREEAYGYTAFIAAALGLGTAVQYRPTLTQSERDDYAALEKSAVAAVSLHRAEAPDDQMREAMNALGAQVLK